MDKKALEAFPQSQEQVKNIPIYEKPALTVYRFQIDSVMQTISQGGGVDFDNSDNY